jgi:ParB family transcriptional regulator, chromosome partitioning protein
VFSFQHHCMSKLNVAAKSISGIIEDLDLYALKRSPENYRTATPSDVEDLANSIMQKGLLQPIIVRVKEGKYQIVAGNRRVQACKNVGWRKIACHIVELSDKDAFEVSLVENIQRKSINPLEEAYAFKMYVEQLGWGGISYLAEKIGKSTSYVDKRLKLLDLPEDVLQRISNSTMNASVAEELAFIEDPEQRVEIAKLATEEKMSSRQTRDLVRQYKKDSAPEDGLYYPSKYSDNNEKEKKAFDKSIIVLKIAMNRLGTIMESVENENWAVYEILMQHKNMINSQIDVLIKQKKKLK